MEEQINSGQSVGREYIVQVVDVNGLMVLTNRGRIFQLTPTSNPDLYSNLVYQWQEIIYPKF